MMKRNNNILGNTTKWIALLAIFMLGGLFTKVEASHMAGGQICYENVGTDSFKVNLQIFRACRGATYNATSVNVTATSTCGGSTTVTLQRVNVSQVQGGQDISQVCTTGNSNCQNSNSTQGYLKYEYEGIFVLRPRCNSWTISHIPPCCRNSTVNTNGGSVYFEAVLYTQTDSANNSPCFRTSAIPYVCAGFPVSYNMGATDPDGDSLTYQFISARSSATNNITYRTGYSALAPIPGITLDSLTGQINFTPNITGAFIVVVQIREYDANGNLKGITMRDIQFRVETCANTPPYDTLGIQNYTGVGFVDTANNLIEVCLGDTFSFQVTIWDYVGYREDSLDTLLITSNVQNVLPNSTFDIDSLNGNDSVHVVTIGWRAINTGSRTQTFFIETSDDACPIPGFTTSSYTVKVIPATEAGPNKIICKGVDTAHVNVIGGTSVTWRVISGDSINYGTNFWCDTTGRDTCMRARFFPSVNTVYEVSSNLGQGCKTKDTVTVFAVSDYTTTTSSDTTICFSDSTIGINVTPSLAGGYSYRWRPSGDKLDFDTAQSPNVTPIFSTNYMVTITSDSGCIKKDSVYVGVTPPFPAEISALADDSVSCAGVQTRLNADLGNNPQNCGVSSFACPGSLNYYTSTNQTNTNQATGSGPAAWPAPYGNGYRSAKMQFLYRASELSNMGISNGMFESIGFYIVSNAGTNTYRNFSIKMGCTTDTVLGLWKTGLYQVFTPKNVTIGTGWTRHYFDQNFNYDGVSNVVVEICFDNSANPATQSAATAYTATGFNSCLSFYTNNAGACASTNVAWGSQVNRPNTWFAHCGAPDSAAYSYQWSPSNLLNNDTLQTPFATVNSRTEFTVTVTDTFGLCYDTASIEIKIATADAYPDTTVCPGDTVQLRAFASPTCQGSMNFYWNNGQFLDNDSIWNPKAVVNQTTDFIVTAQDSCGCDMKDTITITVNPMSPPTALQVEPNCNSSDGQLTVQVNGGWSPFTYSIDTGNIFQFNPTYGGLPQGYYSYVVIDSLGCVSDTVHDTLLMQGAPVIDTVVVTDASCFDFLDGQLQVVANLRGGIPPMEYSVDSGQTWQLQNPITGLGANHYYIMARSASGCESLPYIDTIDHPTPLVMSTLQFSDDTCYQEGVAFIEVGATGSVPPYNYSWSNGVSTALNNGINAGQYVVTLTDDNSCAVIDTFDVDEPSQMTVSQLKFNQVSCFGYSDGEIVVWANGGYDINGETPTYQFSIDGGRNFQGANLFASNDSSVFPNLIAGSYNIMVKDQFDCAAYSNIDVTEPPVMTISSNIDSATICVSNCVQLSANAGGGNGGGYVYHWTPLNTTGQFVDVCPEEDQIYSVYASDSKGCNSPPAYIDVKLRDSLKVLVSNDTAICLGDVAQLGAQGMGGDGNYAYEWYPFIGISNPFIANPTASPTKSAPFRVKLTDECGSPAIEDTVMITVNPSPAPEFTADTFLGCEPTLITFNNASALPGTECFWTFNSDTVYSCGDVTKKFEAAGVYDVSLTVTSELGCTETKLVENMITIHPTPWASFSMKPNPTTILDTKVKFKDESKGKKIRSYAWEFAGLDSSFKQNTQFIFPEDTGSYPVRLTVTTDKGCADDTTINLLIGAEYLMFIPSAFTPNRDGKNEYWKPEGLGVEGDKYEVWVYDRWGKVVWYSNDFSDAWDGTYMESDDIVMQGIYTWKVIAGDAENEKGFHEYYGTVTILK